MQVTLLVYHVSAQEDFIPDFVHLEKRTSRAAELSRWQRPVCAVFDEKVPVTSTGGFFDHVMTLVSHFAVL